MNGDECECGSFAVTSNHNSVDGFEFNLASMNPLSISANLQSPSANIPSMESSSNSDSPYNSETFDFSHAFFKYINDVLMEEESEDKPYMLQDCLALHAAEKSLYEVLGEKYPPSSDQFPFPIHRNAVGPDENVTPTSSVDSSNMATEFNWISDESSVLQPPHNEFIFPPLDLCGDINSSGKVSGVMGNVNMSPPYNYSVILAPATTSKPSKPPDLEKDLAEQYVVNDGRFYASNPSRGRKNYQPDDNCCFEEGRRKKHSAVLAGESEQLEIFDNSFLRKVENNEATPCPLYDASRNEESKKLQQNEQSQASNSRIRRLANDREMMDLSTRLIYCAQAVGSGDQRTAYEQLKQIRLHASPFGNGNQRMAHYFANALEARLAGTENLVQNVIAGPSTTVADILKAYQLYVSICPFRKMTNFFTNRTIAKVVDKANRLHIIDFGISYGFQWPCFIYRQSTRPGGPPKIRITGIDYPQPGFRPAERVEETGRRLKRLADRLNVPFEYNAIAQKWETIRFEDLKIHGDEVVAVCCMYRLKNLPDDTIMLDSPRDTVLKLIKRINPDIFVHGVVNGSFNAPFFNTRFRETLFHYSALFDMFEANATREDQERLVFERELIGKDVMNVIACEGTDRFERPETYKQWQNRNSRIGFRQLPLHQDIMKRVRNIKSDYHKNFVIDEDGHWMLMGWKGRIIHAISAWEAVQE
ncbi:hypothetical protein P3X46_028910 [Hevea brasiliensis]|uniref:Uncharacterized protein n=1 Tax=Hevea brasiliensis TaxID=3981 RepID=A0ABQ9KSG5_HEVBR|nr:scarecrow-like protein 14 [Hevea brasiliensis]KAJ9146674.1 hypothetical protein P3X46_028910 [Hevea brasiliensis]